MKAQLKKYLFLLLPLFVASLNLQAQTSYQLSDAAFTVAGTSSLHDWTMTSNSASGEATLTIEGKALKDIQSVTVTLKAETLKSGKSGMDNNAYKALDTKKNQDIKFNLKEVKSIVNKGDHYLVAATGTLTIAGQSRIINVQGKAYPVANTLKLSGSNSFKMTDFKVDPPTALMGTVKTGDEITVNFNLTLKSK